MVIFCPFRTRGSRTIKPYETQGIYLPQHERRQRVASSEFADIRNKGYCLQPCSLAASYFKDFVKTFFIFCQTHCFALFSLLDSFWSSQSFMEFVAPGQRDRDSRVHDVECDGRDRTGEILNYIIDCKLYPIH